MRLIIVSNRAPVSIIKEENKYTYKTSSGGVASGLSAYVENLRKTEPNLEFIWMGWPGAAVPEDDEEKVRKEILEQEGVQSVFLSEEEMENFYEGFCNKTIWPLFHYFQSYTSYKKEYWEEYVRVNKIFCDALVKILKPGDVLWVQDYHLMLLPAMIRKEIPDAIIGFFLHIPFPSYEVFRLLPSEWRKKILEGLFGADLIGFHTFDYRTYFLRSTLNILGLTDHMGEVMYRDRLVKVESFPMGIDYDKYHNAVEDEETIQEEIKLHDNVRTEKVILSIDRQDYTKGILNRLRAYEYFLEANQQWKKRVTLLLIVIPSRIGVESYQSIKSQIDELVGRINGAYGDIEWTPILYQYRSLNFHELIAMYNSSDVALITPLRDGMNLIAKEYIAARNNNKGVLILSEMTGAAQELIDAVIINPNNMEEISDSMLYALEMSDDEQEKRIKVMQQRVKSYNVFKWADDFLKMLEHVKHKQLRLSANILSGEMVSHIVKEFNEKEYRTIFLDYDGTLVPHTLYHNEAVPDDDLLEILKELSMKEKTSVVIISGRDKDILQKWFGHLPLSFVAEHGSYLKEKNKDWHLIKPVRKTWKKKIIPVLAEFCEKLPGAFIEEKEYSLVFHYRKSDRAFAALRLKELINQLVSFTSNMDVQLVNGNKVLEIRNSGIDKGVAALTLMPEEKRKEFILAIGDDTTDEDLFRSMPDNAFTVKVGTTASYAKYNLYNPLEVRMLLTKLL